ncbi:hypothetical protein SEMRO_72_G040050.1 [Seminavis robusta]|uniref:Uncharacterized protein n=1 Tax=Seminavis robusta TaxID=568900 RepID=A0A9N8H4W5_9STRA|nr:hypothetical protein SEMRO_72_G040050.1 [Seminavis robusta]|eukprot:Sro72_g040050.1 n/a (409) ;mRNA; r:104265-105491
MKNKTFADPKGEAFRHVSNIGSTKTIEQRRVVTELYLKDWRENRGEKEAADHLEKEYCCYPRWNWNYGCSGEVGVYPSNCPNESFNRHGIKSVATDCSKNASLASFLVHTAPKLLKEDAHARADPCTIEIPRTSSLLAVAVTGFMQEGIDVIELGNDEYGNPSSWMCNLRNKIGVPLDKNRVRMVQAALDGDVRPFEERYKNTALMSLPDILANTIVSTTRNVCHLQWKQGNIVGDCEDCVKHLGYSCPGAIYLRSKHGLLQCKVEVLRKSSANARGDAAKACARGNTTGLYKSGLSRTSKRRCLSKMIETFDSYLATLNHQQLSRVVLYLGLYQLDNKGKEPLKGKTSQELLDILLCFSDNQIGYRAMIIGSRSIAPGKPSSSYATVKQLAVNLKKASETPGKENEN